MFSQVILPRTAPGLKKRSLHLSMLRVTLGLVLLTLVTGSKCPNQDLCGEQETCCQKPSGENTCCPFHQGECCEDHLHCCPEGMLCQVMKSKCSNRTHSLPWAERRPVQRTDLSKSFRMVSASTARKDTTICPDESSCPAEFSCLLQSNAYGCCPVTKGIVCSDGKHCCPDNHQCSTDSTSCVKKKEPIQALVCADGLSECPVGTSCCETADGAWSCCPVPRAVCCADKVHCCPEDSVCHVNSSKCVSSTKEELPMWAKFPARLRADWEDRRSVSRTAKTTTTPERTKVSESPAGVSSAVSKGSNVPCDGTWSCPDNTTCCKTEEGSWACCPLPQAVCCEDHIHCCPHGKKCNLAAATCEDPSGSVPWLKKEPSQPRADQKPLVKGPKSSGNISCDSTHYCLNSTTCCKGFDANWNCCPFPQGVCCEDQVHCCPQDAPCNSQTLTCNKGNSSIPMALMRDAPSHQPQEKKKPLGKEEHGRVQCDKHTSCPDHTTCCFIHKTQKWGCCPLTKAVCCEDGEHCCPEQYKCDKSQTTCVKGDVVVPWYTKLPAQSSPAPDLGHGSLACDAHTTCSVGHSCCKLSTGQWGCCPLPQATCCSDGEHCCPAGYSCDVDSGSCVKTIWLQVETVPLTHINNQQKDIQCGGGFSCPDAETCCKTSQATWGCCPLAKAVCCDDMKHCCPAGFTCVEGGVCAQAAGFSWDNWQVFFSKKKRAAIL